jgi:hypothetical protein
VAWVVRSQGVASASAVFLGRSEIRFSDFLI